MKKIFLMAAGLITVLAGYSQAVKTNGQGTNVVSSGVVDPTINGKPYSQYKAEQDALKKLREAAKPAAQTEGIVSINAADARPAPAKIKPMQNQGPDNKTKPVVVTEQAVVDAKQPVKQVVAGPSPFTSGTVASKPAPVAEHSIAGTSLDPNAVAIVPAASKPAGRTPAEIEKATELSASQDKVKAPVKEAAASSTQVKAPVPAPAVETAKPGSTTNNQ